MSSQYMFKVSEIDAFYDYDDDNDDLNRFYNEIFLNEQQRIVLNQYPICRLSINKGFLLSTYLSQSINEVFKKLFKENRKKIIQFKNFEYKEKIKPNITIRVVRKLNQYGKQNKTYVKDSFYFIHFFKTKLNEKQKNIQNPKQEKTKKAAINKKKKNSSSHDISQNNQSFNAQEQKNQDQLKIKKPQNNQSKPKNDQRVQIENKVIIEQQKQPQQLDFEQSKINLDNIQPKLEHNELEHLQLDIYQKYEILKAQMKKKDEEMKQKENQNQRMIIQNFSQNLEKKKKQVEKDQQNLQQMINKYNHQKNHEQPENGYIEEKPYQL